MADIDKNQSMIDYLLTCPYVKQNSIYFNFGIAEDNNKQLTTQATDVATNKPYVDGSVMKRFSFKIMDFKSVGYNAIIKLTGYPDENVVEMNEVKQLITWLNEQEELGNYPDFGPKCLIDRMSLTKNEPNLEGVDTSVNPALAVYSVTINIDYLDTSKVLWS